MRISYAFLLLLLPAAQASGQRFFGGLSAGLTTSQVSGDQLAGFNKAGFYTGAAVGVHIREKTSIQMEIAYMEKGSRKTQRPSKGDYTFYLLAVNYVEVPIMVQYYYRKKFIFETGPSFGTLVKSEEKDEYGALPYQRPFKRYELSFNLGLHYRITNNLLMNWRLTNSVTPIRDHAGGATFRFNRGQYNTVLSFIVRYYLNHHKLQNGS